MNINGTYKISIEMTARVQCLAAEVEKLHGPPEWETPLPPDLEAHRQSMMLEKCKANLAVFDSLEMTITDRSITVRNGEGESVYDIKSKTAKDENNVVLHLHSEQMGELTWGVTFSEKYLLIDSVDPLSEYVFERKG